MDESVWRFYEGFAEEYHLIFSDWMQDVRQQAGVLDRLIQAEMGAKPAALLDCACGIGTQAIGMALLGYQVHATDFSPAALKRAEHEASRLGLPMVFGQADFRYLEKEVPGSFDVVISCDNAFSHLLTASSLLEAVQGMWAKLNPGGLAVISIRDYDAIINNGQHLASPYVDGPEVFSDENGRRVVFQLWDWSADGRTYYLNHFIVQGNGKEWHTEHRVTVSRALLRAELDRALEQAGFTRLVWHMPEASGYYQPVVTAVKG
ncbi:MAG: class I SAM-dependent methyltransferase [Chloroflexota bacterium]|nr:MAG: class I SAM-dependent methyltransferase [Chloroflexota bacterium]